MGTSAELRTRRRVASSVVTCSPKQTRTKTNYGGRKKVGRVHASSLTRIIVGSRRDPSHLCSLHSRVGISSGRDCPNVHMLTVPMATVAPGVHRCYGRRPRTWPRGEGRLVRVGGPARGKGDPIESRPIKKSEFAKFCQTSCNQN